MRAGGGDSAQLVPLTLEVCCTFSQPSPAPPPGGQTLLAGNIVVELKRSPYHDTGGSIQASACFDECLATAGRDPQP